uniref:Uncharacterized protein n=1 Tax=Aegilops tauschii subsp. strangulata TaxID=200361 RepID=A0A453I7A5_AEGTS
MASWPWSSTSLNLCGGSPPGNLSSSPPSPFPDAWSARFQQLRRFWILYEKLSRGLLLSPCCSSWRYFFISEADGVLTIKLVHYVLVLVNYIIQSISSVHSAVVHLRTISRI